MAISASNLERKVSVSAANAACGGILLLDKPVGFTSNAVLQRVRRLYSGIKAGHAGTLDPLASGLLPVCLGEATKFSQALTDADKQYVAEVQLGWRSSTGDAEGQLEPGQVPDFSDEKLRSTSARFIGEIEQTPPMFSAVKVAGKPLYRLARQGQTIERRPRRVYIRSMRIDRRNRDTLVLEVECSKGTYIRSLAEDLGNALGCGAYLAQLRRTGLAGFRLIDSVALDSLEAMSDDERQNVLKPTDAMIGALPSLALDEVTAARIRHGQWVELDRTAGCASGIVRLYGPEGDFIGTGEVSQDGKIRPKRLIAGFPTSP